jgi:DNA-binding NarL/FixJ family response regulator
MPPPSAGSLNPLRLAEAAPTPQGGLKRISRRERDVLRCFASGLTMRKTAEHLGLKVQTVRTYAKTLYEALGVHSRLQAVLALQTGRVLVSERESK